MLLFLSDTCGEARVRHARPRVGPDAWSTRQAKNCQCSQVWRMMEECPPGGEVGHGACAPVGVFGNLGASIAAGVSK